jgi:hypothetical protein
VAGIDEGQNSGAQDQLLLAPSSIFSPARLRECGGERCSAPARAEACARRREARDGRLTPAEKYLKIVSAFRSREYQEQLRRQSPNAGSAGLAVNSPHFTGRALDLYVGGDPVDTKDSNRAVQVRTPVYRWLAQNARRFGFRPYFYEPWHWETLGR